MIPGACVEIVVSDGRCVSLTSQPQGERSGPQQRLLHTFFAHTHMFVLARCEDPSCGWDDLLMLTPDGTIGWTFIDPQNDRFKVVVPVEKK